MKSILLIEDDAVLGESLHQRLQLEGWQVKWCRDLKSAAAQLDPLPVAIVSDVRLPDGLATTWFATLPAQVRFTPWFFLTGYGSVDDALTAVRLGAREYLTKPFDIEKLMAQVQQATANTPAVSDDAVLGVSLAMQRVESMIHRIATQKVSVLLNGESGVGKEIAAQLIHKLDPRANKGAFIAVNCAAVPETMMEAEFFGYEKGSFSGAQRLHRGYLERADHGTLFLDEVGELPANMQAKLLRALQERSFFRLGSESVTRSDFRVVAASNRDLYAEMNKGHFREDLFYRLAVIRIILPPLRERPEDIRWLSQKLLSSIGTEQNRALSMSESFMRDLLARDWRGNVRELRSYLEQSAIMSETGLLDEPGQESPQKQPSVTTESTDIAPLHTMVEAAERSHIERVLAHCSGSVTKSAELLGISRKTLWEKMKRLHISA